MTLLLVDSALPLAHGTPRQRAAAALRRAIAARLPAGVGLVHLTIDRTGTEWACRQQMAAGDRLMGARAGTAALCAPAAAAAPPADPAPGAAEGGPWLSLRRARRIVALTRPGDLVILADPGLAPLEAALLRGGRQVRILDRGEAGWHLSLSQRLPDAAAAGWHRGMAGLLARPAGGSAGASGGASGSEDGPLILPGDLEFDPLYLAKAPSLVALSTGIAWLDRAVLADLAAMQATFAARGAALPEIALAGFAEGAGAGVPEAVVYPDWGHMPGLIGAARALYLPFLSPALAHVARGALGLGTPVIAGPGDAARLGLAAAEGLLPLPAPEVLPGLVARLLDPDLVGEADWQRIIDAAAGDPLPDPLADLPLADLPPDGAATAAPTGPGGQPKRRIPPLVGQPQVLWNPLSRLVLVRLGYLASAGVEDVRLTDAAGTEVNRLMPNAAQKKSRIIRLEGGVVADPAALGGGIGIELHDMGGAVARVFVPVAEFEPLQAEIAMVAREGVLLTGAFWATAALAAQTGGWAVGDAGFPAGLGAVRPVPMPDIGAVAVPFSVPVAAVPGTRVEIWGRGGSGTALPDAPPQRPFVIGPALGGPRPASSPAILALKDRHAGARAWIIGNGPSVRPEDLAAIPPGDVTFCFNRFHLSYGLSPLRETYVVSADTLMIRDFGQEMIDVSAGLALFCVPAAVAGHLSGPHVLLPPGDGYLPVFSTDPAHFVSVGGSSVFVALQMAHYMGIRDVALYGIDYSFSMKLRRDPRFPFPVSYEEGNHFIQSYRGAKPWCPPTWRDISAGFLNARTAFEVTGGRVVNATRGGKLETFPRVDFDRLVAGAVAA